MNEVRIISHLNVAVRITKDDLNKEFLVEGGYANENSNFTLLKAYPFAGWETWEEIEPVALEHLGFAFRESSARRRRVVEQFHSAAVTLEQATENARAMVESLKKSGHYKKAPNKVE